MNEVSYNFLIVDDDPTQRMLVKRALQKKGNVFEAKNIGEAKEILKIHLIDMALVDLALERENEGMELIPLLKRKNIYVVVLSLCEEEKVIEVCHQLGCCDYFVKGNEIQNLSEILKNFEQKKYHRLLQTFSTHNFYTENKKNLDSLRLLLANLSTGRPVLISGPMGAGKTYLATQLHSLDISKSHGPLIAVNLEGLPEQQMNFLFFGRGNPDQDQDQGEENFAEGIFSKVHGGTLLLENIDTMPPSFQKKFLKVLESKEFSPLDSKRVRPTDFLLIGTTEEPLDEKIKSQHFCKNLARRISGLEIHLPPLKERKEDLKGLVRYFLKQGKRMTFNKEAWNILENYPWPYNVAELKEVIESLKHLGKGLIQVEDLPYRLSRLQKEEPTKEEVLSSFQFRLAKEIGLNEFIDRLKKEIVMRTYEESDSSPTKAMKKLGIHSRAFYKYFD